MANDILSQIDASVALTISLASITEGNGRVSTAVSNASPSKPRIIIFAQITMGTNPVANSIVELYLIRGDAASPNIQDDNHGTGTPNGTSDDAFTAMNAQIIGTLRNSGTPATGDVLRGSFIVDEPGLLWSIGVKNRSGVTLNGTGSNHVIRYSFVNPEIQ